MQASMHWQFFNPQHFSGCGFFFVGPAVSTPSLPPPLSLRTFTYSYPLDTLPFSSASRKHWWGCRPLRHPKTSVFNPSKTDSHQSKNKYLHFSHCLKER